MAAILLLLASIALAVAAQDEAADPDFQRFDRELRSALQQRDPAALALLVRWPLTLNQGAGSTELLANAGALQQRFDEVFGGAWREQVLTSGADDVIWRDQIGVANGALWLDLIEIGGQSRLKIATINRVQADPPDLSSAQLQFVCETDKHRIVIDSSGADEDARYRVWNLPHFPPAAPDLVLTGNWELQGTGACAYRVGRFSSGTTTITLNESGGCGPNSEGPPEGARAELDVSIGGQSQSQRWCY